MAAEEQSDRKVSHLETCIKQRCATEFLCAENIPPTDIYQHLLNIYGDQTVDVSTVRQWVECFSRDDSNAKDKPCSGCMAVTSQNEECLN